MKVIRVIPARYASSRFPSKLLAEIHGKPMIWWVYHQAKKLKSVVVATDDQRISYVCDEQCIPFVFTGIHPTAVHRIWEVTESAKADIYVQINGDEPLISPSTIDAVIPDFIPSDIEFSTNIITDVDNAVQVTDSSNIKMVFDGNMCALYISRTPILYPFKSIDFKYHKHVGVVGYNKQMLDFYINTECGRFESIEGFDLIRPIEHGKILQLIYIPNCETLSVDTLQDLDYICSLTLTSAANHRLSAIASRLFFNKGVA